MNIEFSVREENGVVRIKIISPDKPVVIETATGANAADTPVTKAATQKETAPLTKEAANMDDTTEAETTALSAKLTAMNREYERIRKAVYRAKKKLAELVVPNSVPGDTWGQGQAVTSYYGTTTNTTTTHNHVFDKDTDNVIAPTMSDPVMSHKEAETTNTPSPEPVGNCLPFVPEDVHQFIPLANLPEVYQNLLQTWNDLPLPEKLKGLYPDVAQKLHHLLKGFGKAAVQKAIRMVADSPFLLGKITNTRGWKHICFGWLLNPANLKKITANAYAESPAATAAYGDPWPEEYSADNAAQSCFLDPEYMLKGLDPLTDQARSNLAWAAARLGLTKTPAA